MTTSELAQRIRETADVMIHWTNHAVRDAWLEWKARGSPETATAPPSLLQKRMEELAARNSAMLGERAVIRRGDPSR